MAPLKPPAATAGRSHTTALVMRSQQIDFAAIHRSALSALPALLRRWLPGGRIEGHEYVALNPKRHDRAAGSFKIKIDGHRAGAWADFATGEKVGDVISLAAYLAGISQVEAAQKLAKMLGGPDDH